MEGGLAFSRPYLSPTTCSISQISPCLNSVVYSASLVWGILQAAVILAVCDFQLLGSRSFLTPYFIPSIFSFDFQVGSRRSQAYEPLLLENEREAVADLLQYLESELFSRLMILC